jgi:hypothetical protein
MPDHQQRRGRGIAMSEEDLNLFLSTARTCRIATIGPRGTPHVSPLWFLWRDSVLWLNSLVKSQRWVDAARNPAAAIVVDDGLAYDELRGVEMRGTLEAVGDVPRSSAPRQDLQPIERAYAEKYTPSSIFRPDGRHAWLRFAPAKIVSWDFRKLGAR